MALEDFPNNPTIASEITQNVINQTTPQGFKEDPNAGIQPGVGVDPYSQQLIQNLDTQYAPAAIGPQGAGLYPGLKHNINVGGVSGSQIGSGNIYVPGANIMAIDPVLARRKAVDDAAKARAAAIKPFDYGDPYKLKDARFQQKFQDAYYNRANVLVDEAKEKYGKDFSTVLQNRNTPEGRKFVQEMANFEVLGREFDQITDLVADMDIGLQTKEKEYTPETLKLKRDFENLVGNFEQGDIFNSRDLNSMYNKLKGHRSFENYIQEGQFLNQIGGISKQFSYDKDKGEYYKVGTTETVKFGEAIKEVVDSLETTVFANEIAEGVYDRKYMENAIKARLKDSIKQTGTITKKSAGQIQDEQVSAQGQTFDQAREDNNYTYNEDGTLSTSQAAPGQVHYRHDVNLTGKPNKITVKNPDGTIKTIPAQGIPLTQAKFLNGDRTQDFEETAYSRVTGISTVTRGGKKYVVANTSTIAPAKISYKKTSEGWEEIPAQEWKTLTPKKRDSGKYKRETAYREVQVPVVLIDENGQETGTYNEIKEHLKQDASKTALDNAFQSASEQRGTATSTPSGSSFN